MNMKIDSQESLLPQEDVVRDISKNVGIPTDLPLMVRQAAPYKICVTLLRERGQSGTAMF
jgi:hypothetical protein